MPACLPMKIVTSAQPNRLGALKKHPPFVALFLALKCESCFVDLLLIVIVRKIFGILVWCK
jgi:hypothetical protein